MEKYIRSIIALGNIIISSYFIGMRTGGFPVTMWLLLFAAGVKLAAKKG